MRITNAIDWRHTISAQHQAPEAADLATTASDWIVGLGIITLTLFPLALPILALTAFTVGLLVVPVLPLVLLALPVWLVRRVRRKRARARPQRALVRSAVGLGGAVNECF